MGSPDDADETVRLFVTQFIDESFTDAAALFTADGAENVVESFPEEFQQGPMEVEEALERYWRGLYGQYGTFETIADLNVDGTKATAELEFEDWQTASFADGSRLEFYDGLDHYFQAGPTPVTMHSLYFGGNVADYVVADLAEWVNEIASR